MMHCDLLIKRIKEIYIRIMLKAITYKMLTLASQEQCLAVVTRASKIAVTLQQLPPPLSHTRRSL